MEKLKKPNNEIPKVAPDQDKGEVKPKSAMLLEKKEKLLPSDKPFAGAPGPSREYKLQLQQGKSYLIDMQRDGPSTLTPYLRVLDAKGKELAMNTNVSGDLAAQIVFTPPQTGEYTVQATAHPKGPLESLGPLPPDGAGFRLMVREK